MAVHSPGIGYRDPESSAVSVSLAIVTLQVGIIRACSLFFFLDVPLPGGFPYERAADPDHSLSLLSDGSQVIPPDA